MWALPNDVIEKVVRKSAFCLNTFEKKNTKVYFLSL